MQQKVFQQTHNIYKGSAYALFAFFSMSVFGILTRAAASIGDPLWVSFITYTVATFGVAAMIAPKGVASLQSQHYSFLVARAIVGTIASFLYMISMHYIPIINATLLFNTAPIFIPILSVLCFHKKISMSTWGAVIVGFLGIIVIIRPGLNILTDPGNLIGLMAGIALAIAYLIMKMLTATETGVRIIFYYFSIGVLIQAPLLFFTKQPPSMLCVIYSALSGIVLLFAQLGLVKAYTYAEASEVGVYQYSSIVFVALIDWLLWRQTPNLTDLIGFILVSIAGIIIIRKKSVNNT